MMILVINKNKDEKSKFLPYNQRFRLFKSWKAAVIAAKEVGWEDPYGFGVNTTLGMLNNYQCGDIDVSIMAVEVE
jgi:hypothetical protein